MSDCLNTNRDVKLRCIPFRRQRKVYTNVFAASLRLSVLCGPMVKSQTTSIDSITFESFLQHPPIIRELAYEKVSPHQDDIESFILKLDGSNKYLSPVNAPHGSLATGWFDGVFWHYHLTSKVLVFADPKINREIKMPTMPLGRRMVVDNGGPAGEFEHYQLESQMDEVLNLGLSQIDRNTIAWDKTHSSFLAFMRPLPGVPEDKRVGLNIELKYSNNVPVSAIIRNAADTQSSNMGVLITYKYRDEWRLIKV